MPDTLGGRDEVVVRVDPIGDSAFIVVLGDRADPTLTALAHEVAAAIDGVRAAQPWVGRPVTAHASVLVPFDPLRARRADARGTISAAAEAALARATPAAASAAGSDLIELPVRYGGPDGPDLADVATTLGMAQADVVRLHAGAVYRVLFLGFAPGFAYLGGLPPELVPPRRATPRERVPAGSVAIAGEQSAIYPLAMPGGWNLIGRTDARLFDASAPEPARLEAGAVVRFVDAR